MLQQKKRFWKSWLIGFVLIILSGVACTPNTETNGGTTTPVVIDIPVVTEPEGLPDLTAVSLIISMDDIHCFYGQPLGLAAFIKNQGTGNAATFVVRAGSQEITVAGLAAGATQRIWFGSYTDYPPLIIDPTNAITESDESNNSFDQQIPIPTAPVPCTPTPTGGTPTTEGNLPDLIPVFPHITMQDTGCYYGQPFGLGVIIQNNGSADAGSFVVQVGEETAVIDQLAAGASQEVWLASYQAYPPVTVDPLNTVAESNENNNSYSDPIPVPTQPIPCTPTPTP